MKAYRLVGVSIWLALALSLALLLVYLAFVQYARTAHAQEEPESTVEGQVIGGDLVANSEYPFIVALLNRSVRGTAYQQQFCGGTLIDRNSVLTAAHCVIGIKPNRLNVTVGRTVLNSKQGVTRRVSRIFIHPRYRPQSHSHDAAVLKLRAPVRKIRPIKVPAAKQNYLEKKGEQAIVAGWGNTVAQPVGGSYHSNYPDRMQEARVPVRTDRYAKSVYEGSYVPRLMIAAGTRGKDTCQGDSGGPMFKVAQGSHYQIGITSFGAGCGAPGYPGVYTEVNSPPIRSFIVRAARG